MKNWGLDQIGFTVDPTLIFDMTKAKALYALYPLKMELVHDAFGNFCNLFYSMDFS